MNPAEIAAVLTKAAAYDRRTIGRADVAAWHEALQDIDLQDALAAVTRHYRASTEWLMPGHIRDAVAELRRGRRRLGHSDALALPSRFENDLERGDRIRRGVALCRATAGLAGNQRAARRENAFEELRAATTEKPTDDQDEEATQP